MILGERIGAVILAAGVTGAVARTLGASFAGAGAITAGLTAGRWNKGKAGAVDGFGAGAIILAETVGGVLGATTSGVFAANGEVPFAGASEVGGAVVIFFFMAIVIWFGRFDFKIPRTPPC